MAPSTLGWVPSAILVLLSQGILYHHLDLPYLHPRQMGRTRGAEPLTAKDIQHLVPSPPQGLIIAWSDRCGNARTDSCMSRGRTALVGNVIRTLRSGRKGLSATVLSLSWLGTRRSEFMLKAFSFVGKKSWCQIFQEVWHVRAVQSSFQTRSPGTGFIALLTPRIKIQFPYPSKCHAVCIKNLANRTYAGLSIAGLS